MYAEIVVNHPSRAVDRLFDYEIPKDLEDKIVIGSRVIVPFSKWNTGKEGFVLRIKEKSDIGDKAKSIIRLLTEMPAFKPDMAELILYMHHRYLAPLIDIVNAIVPSGTARQIRMVTLAVSQEEAEDFLGKSRSEIQKRMISVLMDTERIATADLVKFSGGNYQALNALLKKGMIKFFEIGIERSIYDTKSELLKPNKPTAQQQKAISEINCAIDDSLPHTMLLHGVTGSGKQRFFCKQ